MLKIPTAKEMADLAAVSRKNYEESVMKSSTFKQVVSEIERAALEGKGDVFVPVKDEEHRLELEVIKKYLFEAGYICDFFNKFALAGRLNDSLRISWRTAGDEK